MEPTSAAIATERLEGRLPATSRRRVVVERLWPEIDAGRFPIKRTLDEAVTVTVDMFADGHDEIAGVLKYRYVPSQRCVGADLSRSHDVGADLQVGPWEEVPLAPLGNDSWGASILVDRLGAYEYTVEGWVDRFGSWLKGLVAKAQADQDVSSELLEGADIVQQAVGRLKQAAGRLKPALTESENAPTESENVGAESKNVGAGFSRPDDAGDTLRLLEFADTLRGPLSQRARVSAACDLHLRRLMDARPDRTQATTYDRVLTVTVDPVRARFGAWYEMFPRSCTSDPARSGTFREAERRLADIASMGFDVLYLPPIHPIGRTHRKGRNNSLRPAPGDPGSPWAIGAEKGGHTAIEPDLGTIDDFDRFLRLANRLGLEIALDVAFQTSPDHPWVREHPAWFKHRPDGTIKYAENPPKKYQDIYPFDFETSEWESLWAALRDVFLFWISHGVKTFRVDNPHTKSFPFWEWCIREIQRRHPDTVFLSEAFTRPKVMRYLAKACFSQSYTYFTWRNHGHELREYLTELTRTELQEYMRPNFFANTPDILNEYLQTGGRPAFEVRLILAATLSASYGIYSGFELCENVPVRPGSEEYLDSEKYQIKPRDWSVPGNLKELIARVNHIRRTHPALQQNATLAFHATDTPQLLFYSKRAPALPAKAGSYEGAGAAPALPAKAGSYEGAGAAPALPAKAGSYEGMGAASVLPAKAGSYARSYGDGVVREDRVFVVASTDPHWEQAGWVQMPTWELDLGPRDTYVVEDLLDGARYTWRGEWNYVKLGPSERMAHIFVIRDS